MTETTNFEFELNFAGTTATILLMVDGTDVPTETLVGIVATSGPKMAASLLQHLAEDGDQEALDLIDHIKNTEIPTEEEN